MPLRVFISLLSVVILASGLTLAIAFFLGVPMAVLGLVAVVASAGLLWFSR